jgi:hypothetical protein
MTKVYKTEQHILAEYIARFLMYVKHQFGDDRLKGIIENGIVVDELSRHYDWYHMYPEAVVLEALQHKEPLLVN